MLRCVPASSPVAAHRRALYARPLRVASLSCSIRRRSIVLASSGASSDVAAPRGIIRIGDTNFVQGEEVFQPLSSFYPRLVAYSALRRCQSQDALILCTTSGLDSNGPLVKVFLCDSKKEATVSSSALSKVPRTFAPGDVVCSPLIGDGNDTAVVVGILSSDAVVVRRPSSQEIVVETKFLRKMPSAAIAQSNTNDPTSILSELVALPPAPWQSGIHEALDRAKVEAAEAAGVASRAEAAAKDASMFAASARVKANVLHGAANAIEVALVNADASWRSASVPQALKEIVAKRFPALASRTMSINPHATAGSELYKRFAAALASNAQSKSVDFLLHGTHNYNVDSILKSGLNGGSTGTSWLTSSTSQASAMLLLDDSEIFDASDAELNEASAELQTHLVSSTGAAHRRLARTHALVTGELAERALAARLLSEVDARRGQNGGADRCWTAEPPSPPPPSAARASNAAAAPAAAAASAAAPAGAEEGAEPSLSASSLFPPPPAASEDPAAAAAAARARTLAAARAAFLAQRASAKKSAAFLRGLAAAGAAPLGLLREPSVPQAEASAGKHAFQSRRPAAAASLSPPHRRGAGSGSSGYGGTADGPRRSSVPAAQSRSLSPQGRRSQSTSAADAAALEPPQPQPAAASFNPELLLSQRASNARLKLDAVDEEGAEAAAAAAAATPRDGGQPAAAAAQPTSADATTATDASAWPPAVDDGGGGGDDGGVATTDAGALGSDAGGGSGGGGGGGPPPLLLLPDAFPARVATAEAWMSRAASRRAELFGTLAPPGAEGGRPGDDGGDGSDTEEEEEEEEETEEEEEEEEETESEEEDGVGEAGVRPRRGAHRPPPRLSGSAGFGAAAAAAAAAEACDAVLRPPPTPQEGDAATTEGEEKGGGRSPQRRRRRRRTTQDASEGESDAARVADEEGGDAGGDGAAGEGAAHAAGGDAAGDGGDRGASASSGGGGSDGEGGDGGEGRKTPGAGHQPGPRDDARASVASSSSSAAAPVRRSAAAAHAARLPQPPPLPQRLSIAARAAAAAAASAAAKEAAAAAEADAARRKAAAARPRARKPRSRSQPRRASLGGSEGRYARLYGGVFEAIFTAFATPPGEPPRRCPDPRALAALCRRAAESLDAWRAAHSSDDDDGGADASSCADSATGGLDARDAWGAPVVVLAGGASAAAAAEARPRARYYRCPCAAHKEVESVVAMGLGLDDDRRAAAAGGARVGEWRLEPTPAPLPGCEPPPGSLSPAQLSGWYNLMWTWSSGQRPPKPEDMLVWQKANHFAGIAALTRKDALKRHLERARVSQGPAFELTPPTFTLPNEYPPFCEAFGKALAAAEALREPRPLWIVKPVGLSRGRGIFLIDDLTKLTYADTHVAQRYVDSPLLIDGHKFDLRLYVLVTSFAPLEAFIFADGFARFSSEKYTRSDPTSADNLRVHLTNYAVQKHSGVPGPLARAPPGAVGGSKCSLAYCIELLKARGALRSDADAAALWARLAGLARRTLFAVHDAIPFQPNAFELLGFDVILDASLRPWLLEVNASPSLATETELDRGLKTRLVADVASLLDPPAFDRRALSTVLRRRAGMPPPPPPKVKDGVWGGASAAAPQPPADASPPPLPGPAPLVPGTRAEERGQLEADLAAILRGCGGGGRPRAPGEPPARPGRFQQLAPGPEWDALLKKGARAAAAATGGGG